MKLEIERPYQTLGTLLKPNKRYVVSSSGGIKVTRQVFEGAEPLVAFVLPNDYIELREAKTKSMLTVENRESCICPFTVYVSEN